MGHIHDYDAPVTTARQMLREGHDLEDVLRFLRGHGSTIIDSIKLTMQMTGLPLGAAKELVHTSQAWGDRREAHARFHEVLEDAIDDVATLSRASGAIESRSGDIPAPAPCFDP